MTATAATAGVPSPSPNANDGCQCFLCNEPLLHSKVAEMEMETAGKESPHKNFLYGERKGQLKEMEKQVAVFFLLRKVLDLPTDFLETLLSECGSPSSWNIQLCRHCTRLFKEAEYLWDKVNQIQREFFKVSFEIQDVITQSITLDEVKTVNMKDEKAQKAVVSKKLKTCNVVDGVRTTFFLNLKDQTINNANMTGLVIKPSNLKVEDIKDRNRSGSLQWNEKGIPYLSMADFEKKMKELIVMTTTTQSSLEKRDSKILFLETTTQTMPDIDEVNPKRLVIAENNEEGEEDMEIDTDETGPKITSVTSKASNTNDSIELLADENLPASPCSVNLEPTGSIRIVQTSSLMEPESDSDSDNEAAPQLIGVLKRECERNTRDCPQVSMDMDSGDSLGDPLALDEASPVIDVDDSDYTPDSPAPTRKNKGKSSTLNKTSKENKANKKLAETPSRLRFLLIEPRKTGPKSFECSKCSGVFDTRLGCQSHVMRDHYEDRQPFHCHICAQKFTINQSLKEHVFNAHGGIRTPYDDDFDPATDYVTLEFSKTLCVPEEQPDPKKPLDRRAVIPMYDCPVCSQQFTVKRNMQRHAKNVHEVSTSECADPSSFFPCVICQSRNITFRAKTKEVLDVHIYKFHQNSKNVATKIIRKTSAAETKPKTKKTMKCPDCGKILPSAAAIVEHLKNPEHKCTECPKHFMFHLDLKRHMELQHGERNAFQCPYCPKSFTVQIIYDKHIENHQIRDQHECEVCHEKFTGLGNLSRHLETHADILQHQQSEPVRDPEIFGI